MATASKSPRTPVEQNVSEPAEQALNADCYCRTLDDESLRRRLLYDAESYQVMAELLAQRPTLFSSTAVFLSPITFRRMVEGIACIERVIRCPGYQAAVLEQAPPIASRALGPLGVFVSYDFHLAPEGPRLIEINSNAGGALLGASLVQAQHACCQAMQGAMMSAEMPSDPRPAFLAMFEEEWRRQRTHGVPRNILIVDDEPGLQYLAPEFQLFAKLFTQNFAACDIVDAATLQWRDGQLHRDGEPVDMVYNRLTDFYLTEPRHAALRAAYEAGAVVLTPNPRTHALYADKRNLIHLCDASALERWGVPTADVERLSTLVPATQLVTPDKAEALWAQRRTLFFKPTAGFGAKAAYRGDKLTRRVWDQILAGNYIAQALIVPAERAIEVDGAPTRLKFDLRAYTYDGSVQFLTARMYGGQTTNFRTPGGGFAPVFVLPESASSHSASTACASRTHA